MGAYSKAALRIPNVLFLKLLLFALQVRLQHYETTSRRVWHSAIYHIDRRLLQAELTVASRMWHSHCQTQYKNKDAPTITTYQQLLTKIHVAFPNSLKGVQVALTLPVTSSTFLRNRMSDGRLSNMATLFISKYRVKNLRGLTEMMSKIGLAISLHDG